ncbi:MAG TPA: glycosyltransferase family 2 protein [Vicinamibacterales bacterium]|jgi:glycosyltransferase involved in cell wall biosynthesis|nr:glycosyltransferase family 2 protein [Vicinamibacterales bacterium]
MTISADSGPRAARRRAPWPPLPADAGVTVVIPTRNEEGGIARIIDAVRPHATEILVVDGRSTDRTREIAAARCARVIEDTGRGKGEALRLSFTEARGDILVFIDADGSHDPGDIPRLVEPIRLGEAELVIASRTRGGSDELHGTAEQLLRYVGSQLIMLAINYRWRVHLTDSQNGYRALRRDVALALNLTSNLTTIEQEMLMKALRLGCRVEEVPSHEFERQWGVSKVRVWRLWWAYLWSLFRNLF